MAKNDNAHAIRFYNSLEKNCGSETAQEFASKYQISKSSNIEKKFEWAQDMCRFLSEKFDDDTIMTIRMDCACGPEMGKCKKVQAVYEKSGNHTEFVEKVNKLNLGYTLEYDGESFYLIYPQCYCSCVKNIGHTLPETWCYCTLGYTKRMFEFVFDSEVDVALVNSVKQGDDNCRIRIKRK